MANLKRHKTRHFFNESEKTGMYLLFTVEANDILTIYKIKSFLTAPLSNVINNFKMAKRSSLLLEYPVKNIEWITSSNAITQRSTITAQNFRSSKVLIQPNFLVTYVE